MIPFWNRYNRWFAGYSNRWVGCLSKLSASAAVGDLLPHNMSRGSSAVAHSCGLVVGQLRLVVQKIVSFPVPRIEAALHIMVSTHGFEKLGFIGLGAMGKPMVSHLANKLPSDSRIWVYDVVQQVVDDLCAEFPERIVRGASAKDVAENVVSPLQPTIGMLIKGTPGRTQL